MTRKTHQTTHRPKNIRINWLCAGVLLGAAAGSLTAQTNSAPPNNYLVHNLVSDLANTADYQDPNLVNPWGAGFGATPIWVRILIVGGVGKIGHQVVNQIIV